jgi:hypothetical protein
MALGTRGRPIITTSIENITTTKPMGIAAMDTRIIMTNRAAITDMDVGDMHAIKTDITITGPGTSPWNWHPELCLLG